MALDKSGWVSLELWDNTLEESLQRYNTNKWGISKDHKSNLRDLFFYGLIIRHEGQYELFSLVDGYIFLKLNDCSKLPPLSKIHGAMDWVRAGGSEGNSPVVILKDDQVSEMKKFVEKSIHDRTSSLREGGMVRVVKGLYRGMEGVIEGKDGIFIDMSFYLNSKNCSAKIPFWFIQND